MHVFFFHDYSMSFFFFFFFCDVHLYFSSLQPTTPPLVALPAVVLFNIEEARGGLRRTNQMGS